MKVQRLLLALWAGLGISFTSLAQSSAPPHQKAYLEANNIRSSINTLGNMWFDPDSSYAECEYPKGSGKNAGYASAIWVAGKVHNDTVIGAVATKYSSGGAKRYLERPAQHG